MGGFLIAAHLLCPPVGLVDALFLFPGLLRGDIHERICQRQAGGLPVLLLLEPERSALHIREWPLLLFPA